MKLYAPKQNQWKALFCSLLLWVSGLVSCGGEDTAAPEAEGETIAEIVAETEEETAYAADYLPDVTYEGYEYRIIEYEEYLLHQEELTGSVIDDAIYQRNMLAEEKFDINITSTRYPYAKYGEVGKLLKQAGRAQTDDYDLYFVVFADAYSALIEGAMPPASSLPYTDPTRPWYYHAINEGMSIRFHPIPTSGSVV